MQYRTFPKFPDEKISVLGFGCMRLPIVGGNLAQIDEPAATLLLRRAINAGVNYVDTAYPYHGGQSETFVGRALQGGYRAKVQLATKLPVWLVQHERDWERLLSEQLKRLHTEQLDFYMLHALNADSWQTVEKFGGLQAMARFQEQGRIRHVGFSFHDSLTLFKRIVDAYPWEFCQIQYNYIDTEFQAGTAGLEYAAARQIGVIAMEPLRGGALTRNLPLELQRLWAQSGSNRSPAAWALDWVFDRPEVVTALSGMNGDAQLTDNLQIAGRAKAHSLSAAEHACLAEAARLYRSKLQVGCTSCGYCEPCPQGVAIPAIFNLYNSSAMFGETERLAAWYQQMFANAEAGADRCTECRECESKCPQSLNIVDKLKDAHALLGVTRG